ncbi:MAG TPA: TetR family transcriptional regulator [Ktedonobacterales bacterium]|nr:TetR family transcriptional regulator [Ktedonobacterales bacterium]
MAAPNKREAQAEARRNQLLDVARRLFAEQGMERTSIKDIALAAGVAQGLIYHYFRSKDDLFWAIIERDGPLPVLAAIFSGAETLPVRESLVRAMTRGYAAMAERQDLLRIVLHEALARPQLQERLRTFQRMILGLMAGYLDGRVAAGELRPHDTQLTARMIGGALFALQFTGLPAEPYVGQVVDTLLRGIEAR